MAILGQTLRTVRDNFAPLRYPNFRLYLGGQAISLIGTWLQFTAQSWVVWTLTKSEASLGVVNMLGTLPVLFLGPFAGVWVDRIDRRRLLIGTQFTAMLLAFILAALSQTGLVQIWHVYFLSICLGIANALDMPAQQSFLGDLSGMSEVRKAINLNIMILQISRILGPSLAGLIVARVGIAPAFWLNGLSFLAVIASLILVRTAAKAPKAPSTVSPLRQIAEGATYLRNTPRLQDLFLFATLLTFFVFSIIMNILPAVATKLLNGDAATLGVLMSASGVGALIAVLIIVPITQSFKRSGVVMAGACFWLAFWLSVFSHSHLLPLSMLALMMGSMGAPTLMTMAMGLVQLMSPLDMRGRLISLFTVISFGMTPLAAVWIGQTAEHLGVETAIQINAILLVIGASAMVILRPAILRYEYAPAAESPKIEAERVPGVVGEIPTLAFD